MDKERILVILREHEPELKAAGLLHLRLFGSVARGENTPGSAIDLWRTLIAPETLCPGVEWPEVRGLGNRLRHEYDRIEDRKVWNMVHDNLPPLRIALPAALEKLTNLATDPA